MRFIRHFDGSTELDASHVGGKAAHLAHLDRLGFRIPRGLVLTTEAFSDMIRRSPSLEALILDLEDTDDFEEMLEVSVSIQHEIRTYSLPDDLIDELSFAINSLAPSTGTPFGFAVRSSATIEDMNEFSFAGQASTYLCVSGLDGVIDAIRGVWASILSPEAVIYLRTKGVSLQNIRMGVIIQEMVNADVSGVMFTANVIENRMDQLLIESTWGLGESLVGGKVVPDSFIIDKSSMKPISKAKGTKSITMSIGEQGTATQETPSTLRESYTLTDDEIVAIAKLGIAIENDIGCPQDIEWAKCNNELVVLQTRPITTLGK